MFTVKTRIVSLLLVLVLAGTMLPFAAFAEDEGAAAETADAADDGEGAEVIDENAVGRHAHTGEIAVSAAIRDSNSYNKYYEKYQNESKPTQEVKIAAKDYTKNDGATLKISSVDGKNDVLEWANVSGKVTWSLDVPKTGIYHIKVSYRAREDEKINTNTHNFELQLDGKSPFESAERIELNKRWDNDEIKQDWQGNDILPSQNEIYAWLSSPIIDSDGLFNEPLYFYLTEGKHELTLIGEKANLYIESFTLYNDTELPSYDDIKPSESQISSSADLVSEPIKVEGEGALYKTHQTLQPTSDTSSYLTSPFDPVIKKYNTIGKGNWKYSGQTITWETEVPADGYYKISMRIRQNQLKGFYSTRRIYIDGEVPCKELDQYSFFYSLNWQKVTLQKKDEDGNKEDMYFYLTKGKHTIAMEVVPGSIGETMRSLEDVLSDINTYYRKIIMITGPKPDEYTDYDILTQIPDLKENFERIIATLYDEKNKYEKLAGVSGSEAATLQETAVILQKCLDKPRKIPLKLNTIKESISTLSSWMSDYRNQPLELDYIELGTENTKFSSNKQNGFVSFWYGIESFVGSFFTDYTNLSEQDKSKETITVWVQQGRDQAQVVKELVDSKFTQEYDIKVNVNLVTTGLTQAVLSGRAPDIALFSGGDYPIQLGARGKLVDITEFSDYDEVMTRFSDQISTLYTYNGSVYALPITQAYAVMFYREDIISELGWEEPPKTWDEFISLVRDLQRSYLSAGLILPQALESNNNLQYSNTIESGHGFAMLLLQKGLNFYNSDLTATTFDTLEATEVFEKWTDFYTVFNFEQRYDAYSRFRTGEYPVVINNYSFFNQLYISAPEIRGLWKMAVIPGTEREDGTISHASNSTGAGAMILTKDNMSDEEYAKYKENCWTFIKWFTSEEIQTLYGNKIEGIMGQMGRLEAANKEALKNLSWSSAELKVLEDTRDELQEIPVIPASYTVTRNIMNAFRAVVNDHENPRDTLITYNTDINEEIERKNEQLRIEIANAKKKEGDK